MGDGYLPTSEPFRATALKRLDFVTGYLRWLLKVLTMHLSDKVPALHGKS